MAAELEVLGVPEHTWNAAFTAAMAAAPDHTLSNLLPQDGADADVEWGDSGDVAEADPWSSSSGHTDDHDELFGGPALDPSPGMSDGSDAGFGGHADVDDI